MLRCVSTLLRVSTLLIATLLGIATLLMALLVATTLLRRIVSTALLALIVATRVITGGSRWGSVGGITFVVRLIGTTRVVCVGWWRVSRRLEE